MNLKKVAIRAISGLVYVAIVTALICCGYVGILILAGLFTVLATLEFDHITNGYSRKRMPVLVIDVLMNLSLALAAGPQWKVLIPMWIALIMLRFIIQLGLRQESPFRSLASSLMSNIYIAMPMLCMTMISLPDPKFGLNEYGKWLIMGLFVLIWLNDTGAFLVGSMIGRHKMAQHISPKKTWEGFVGGMIFTVVAAIVGLSLLCDKDEAWLVGLIYGLLVSIFATLGDLTESLIKRDLGLKDSGTIMPGHGGILDRIDSLLFVLPMTAVVLYIYHMGIF